LGVALRSVCGYVGAQLELLADGRIQIADARFSKGVSSNPTILAVRRKKRKWINGRAKLQENSSIAALGPLQ
jgi:hypothetical protein